MRLTLDINLNIRKVGTDELDSINHLLAELFKQGHKIMVTQAEVATDLVGIKDKLVKIGGETTGLKTKIDELEAAIAAGGPVTQEVTDALQAVKDQLQIVDDLVPDAA